MGSSKGGGHNSPVHPTGLAKKERGGGPLGSQKFPVSPRGREAKGGKVGYNGASRPPPPSEREIGSRLITFGRWVRSRSINSSPFTIHKGKTKKNNSIHSFSAFPFIGHVTAGGRRKLSVPIVVPPRSFWSLMWAVGGGSGQTPSSSRKSHSLFSFPPLDRLLLPLLLFPPKTDE